MLQNSLTDDIWEGKYRLRDSNGLPIDQSVSDTNRRVARAVYVNDRPEHEAEALGMLERFDFVPGGRTLAGAGSPHQVTMINCFVSRKIEDSMQGILAAFNDAILTMQKGGGIGMDFSTLRPNGARVRGVGATSSGPLSFMDTWDAGCRTIESAGNRRGAMMATMMCDHPDLLDFIVAKRTPGRLTQFNLSVMVTDDFMSALAAGEMWDLGFSVPRGDGEHVEVLQRNGEPWYVYKRLPAREIWEMILRNSYEHAEPGLIFIDRVNQRNNLFYCEEIRCSNPCGEQMLPPFGDCNLGAINLANFVLNPFSDDARFDMDRFRKVVAESVRFLDNVLDVTKFPLPEQAAEAAAKRRIGLGFMGLGNMLMMMKTRYGKPALPLLREILSEFADAAYEASAMLAAERGSFPAYEAESFLAGYNVTKRSKRVRNLIAKHGIRNGVLLTIAPTGTTAIYAGNVSSGLEPTFSFRYRRSVRQADNSMAEYTVADKGWLDYCKAFGFDAETHPTGDNLPDYMVTALDLTVEDHLTIQAVCQEYIDASISKTINCPSSMSFEAFEKVYESAWEMGCKGCTTYRPSGTRGAILVSEDKPAESGAPKTVEKVSPKFRRPAMLSGRTHKVAWNNGNLYITINNTRLEMVSGGTFEWPIEVFIRPTSPSDIELMDALGITITALLRQTATMKQHEILAEGADMSFLFEHLSGVQSVDQAKFHANRYIPSRAALIAFVLKQHFAEMQETSASPAETPMQTPPQENISLGEVCPVCSSPTLIREEGCSRCLTCDHSKCG